jgi:alpha-D-ribose 1-methylphosphonate 5-triphosphate diphosphatase
MSSGSSTRRPVTVRWAAGTVVAADQVLSPGTVSVGDDGGIVGVCAGVVRGAVDFGGRAVLAPGAVDLHGDALEKLAQPRTGVLMPVPVALRALDHRLAAAGVTTAYSGLSLAGDELDSPGRGVAGELASLVHELPRPLVEHRLHLQVEISDTGGLAMAEDFIDSGEVDLVTVTNHPAGTGRFRTADAGSPRREAGYGNGSHLRPVQLATRETADSDVGEVTARIAAAARRHATPLAWQDVDSPETVARAATLGAVIAVFPATLPAALAAGPAGLTVAMSAPNLLAAAAASRKLGTAEALAVRSVDLLVSDYYPEAMWPAVLGGDLPLPEAVHLVATRPARAAGLTDRGELSPGQRADMVALTPDGSVIGAMLAGRRTL